MNGNVYEWCADLYQSTTYNISHYNDAKSNDGMNINVMLNPINNAVAYASSPPRRVYRGGLWDSAANYLRAGSRGSNYAYGSSGIVGFRPVFLFPFAP
jgi:formylglycine-generating enzyme required for sulfatase activity